MFIVYTMIKIILVFVKLWNSNYLQYKSSINMKTKIYCMLYIFRMVFYLIIYIKRFYHSFDKLCKTFPIRNAQYFP